MPGIGFDSTPGGHAHLGQFHGRLPVCSIRFSTLPLVVRRNGHHAAIGEMDDQCADQSRRIGGLAAVLRKNTYCVVALFQLVCDIECVELFEVVASSDGLVVDLCFKRVVGGHQ